MTAHRPGAQEQPNWLALLTSAAHLSEQRQTLAEDYVEHCRMHGISRAGIGSALGVTRQAVQHRNNYIGTEHLLFGSPPSPTARPGCWRAQACRQPPCTTTSGPA
ncbi:hypothetical protein ABZT02_19235 [Streptomyces sp. NPDC005402]|uniref:hypothetical protein n=1 Tax=Streptomyces sp. NPDC005402 TaxID=3155338 RepID=UPI0033A4487D